MKAKTANKYIKKNHNKTNVEIVIRCHGSFYQMLCQSQKNINNNSDI